MLKKTITYVDYDDVERTEDFYFNLTQVEVTEMQVSTDGGLINMINRVIAAQDSKTLMAIFKDLIFRSYGEKSPDGKRFVKSQELSEAFSQTEAYNKFFMEFMQDEVAAADFVNGVIPQMPENQGKPQVKPAANIPIIPATPESK